MRRRTVITVVLAVAVLLAACSSGGSGGYWGSSSSSRSRYGTGTTQKSTPTKSSAAGGATVQVGDTSLGQVLTDSAGKTLYLYANDDGTTSKVPAGVLAAWPPVQASGTPTVGAGLDAAKLTTAKQANGQTWVAYNGHLVYTFTGDATAGDVKGQGLANVWYAVTPQGDQLAS